MAYRSTSRGPSPYAVKSAYVQGQKSARRMMSGGTSRKKNNTWLLLGAVALVVVFWKKIKAFIPGMNSDANKTPN